MANDLNEETRGIARLGTAQHASRFDRVPSVVAEDFHGELVGGLHVFQELGAAALLAINTPCSQRLRKALFHLFLPSPFFFCLPSSWSLPLPSLSMPPMVQPGRTIRLGILMMSSGPAAALCALTAPSAILVTSDECEVVEWCGVVSQSLCTVHTCNSKGARVLPWGQKKALAINHAQP